MEHALTGYPLVLKKGKALSHEDKIFKYRHPRTAAGLNKDKDVLYLVVVDGRQSGWSWGLRTFQLGQLFKAIGATRAVNLDGGGSSTMVIPSLGGVINRPCARKGPERKVLSHLGIIEKKPTKKASILLRLFTLLYPYWM